MPKIEPYLADFPVFYPIQTLAIHNFPNVNAIVLHFPFYCCIYLEKSAAGEIYATNNHTLKITNCVNLANITQSTEEQGKIGGICGGTSSSSSKGSICLKNCVSEGSVTGKLGYSGGICGYAALYNDTEAKISNCIVTGKISIANGKYGGIFGYGSTEAPYSGSTAGVIGIQNSGYLKGVADKAIGESAGSITLDATVYDESKIPSASVIVPFTQTLKVGATSAVATIYPEKAYNKDSVKVAVNSEDSNVAISGGNNLVKGVNVGSTTLNCDITELPGQSEKITMSQKVTVEKGEDPEPEPTPSSGGGGGGCNAGFGALALLMALPMIYRRKK